MIYREKDFQVGEISVSGVLCEACHERSSEMHSWWKR